MREITISEFKAKCHSLIREVGKTKQPLCITRDGQPLVEIVPPSPVSKRHQFLDPERTRLTYSTTTSSARS